MRNKFFFCRMIPGGSTKKNGHGRIDNGMNWLMYELLWRDFFRYCHKVFHLIYYRNQRLKKKKKLPMYKQLAGHDGIMLGIPFSVLKCTWDSKTIRLILGDDMNTELHVWYE